MNKRQAIQKITALLLAVSLMFSLFAPAISAEAGSAMTVRILETTDIHAHIMNYDYYKDSATDAFGLARAAGLIKQARAEVKNSLLFDNGDLIQGNLWGIM